MTGDSFADLVRQVDAGHPSQARSAALLLHTMAADDRQWILAHLTPAQLASVQPMVEELGALALPTDPELVRCALSARATAQAPAADADDTLLRSIEQADPLSVAALLAREPAAFVAQVISLHPWPWADGVVAELQCRLGDSFLAQTAVRSKPETQRRPLNPLDRQALRVLCQRLSRANELQNPKAATSRSRRTQAQPAAWRAWLAQAGDQMRQRMIRASFKLRTPSSTVAANRGVRS